MIKTIKLANLQVATGDKTSQKDIVSDCVYDKFETYVHSSDLSLYRVKAVGKLHFNIVNDGSGRVERCNRLVILSNLIVDTDLYYTYLCDHAALNPPEEGMIVDAKLTFIDYDESSRQYYWADSIIHINGNVEINLVANDYCM